MKRVIGLVFICGAASCVAAIAAPQSSVRDSVVAAASVKKTVTLKLSPAQRAKLEAEREAKRHAAMLLLAPADYYFGPLKLSIIGMRNTIRDLGLRYDVNHDISKQTFSSAQLVERSVREWQKKYDRDPQLPRVIFVLQRLYTKILTQESRDRARATAQWLQHDFARTPQAKQMAKTLAVEHLAALPPPTPEAAAAPPAEPTYASIFGRTYPSEFAAPMPSSTTSPMPTGRIAPKPVGSAMPLVSPMPTVNPTSTSAPTPLTSPRPIASPAIRPTPRST